MSLYEQRLSADKAEIRARLVAVGDQVREAVAKSVKGLIEGDEDTSYKLILDDLPINRETRAIDKLCHAFVARHLPSAGHLRFVSSALRMTVELERIGDYAVSIARQAVQLEDPLPEGLAADIRGLSDQACAMLRQAIKAFAERDSELARSTKPLAKRIQRDYGHMFRALTNDDAGHTLRDAAVLLIVYSRLERVTSQAKNICEETLFETLGETKPPKRYGVLFVDARNSLISPLAEALARRAFPESGSYDSAGWNAGDALAPELVRLAEELGLDLEGIRPSALEDSLDALEPYHVIVCLNEDTRRRITNVPFQTVVLSWDVPHLSSADGGNDLGSRLHDIARALSSEIRELMVTMRGEGAS